MPKFIDTLEKMIKTVLLDASSENWKIAIGEQNCNNTAFIIYHGLNKKTGMLSILKEGLCGSLNSGKRYIYIYTVLVRPALYYRDIRILKVFSGLIEQV